MCEKKSKIAFTKALNINIIRWLSHVWFSHDCELNITDGATERTIDLQARGFSRGLGIDTVLGVGAGFFLYFALFFSVQENLYCLNIGIVDVKYFFIFGVLE